MIRMKTGESRPDCDENKQVSLGGLQWKIKQISPGLILTKG